MKTPDRDRSQVAAAILAGRGVGEFEADLWLSEPLRLGLPTTAAVRGKAIVRLSE